MTNTKKKLLKKIGPAIDTFTALNTRVVVLEKIAGVTDKQWARQFFEAHWPQWYGKRLPPSTKISSALEHQNIMVARQERFIIGFRFSSPPHKKIVAHFNFSKHKIQAPPLKAVYDQDQSLISRPLGSFMGGQMLVREFSPGTSFHQIIKKGNLKSAHLKAVAKTLHQLHRVKTFSLFPKKNPILKFLTANLKRNARLNPALYPILASFAKTSVRVINESAGKTPVLCHGDASPSNIIFSGNKAQLIDWDLAHQNEPVYDLAYLSAHLVDTMTIKEVSPRKITTAKNTLLKAYRSKFSQKRFLAWEALILTVIVDHLLQSYCYDHLKSRMDFMLKMAEEDLFLCEKIKG